MRALSKVRLLLVGIVVVAATLTSQNRPPGSTAIPNYDLKTEVRISGIVLDAKDHPCPISGGLGSHLLLKTQDGTIEVHLGPSKFVNENQLILDRGNTIEVLGSRVIFEGRDALLAREITRGEETFVFRDANGKPVW